MLHLSNTAIRRNERSSTICTAQALETRLKSDDSSNNTIRAHWTLPGWLFIFTKLTRLSKTASVAKIVIVSFSTIGAFPETHVCTSDDCQPFARARHFAFRSTSFETLRLIACVRPGPCKTFWRLWWEMSASTTTACWIQALHSDLVFFLGQNCGLVLKGFFPAHSFVLQLKVINSLSWARVSSLSIFDGACL